jgi:hypothetical protein
LIDRPVEHRLADVGLERGASSVRIRGANGEAQLVGINRERLAVALDDDEKRTVLRVEDDGRRLASRRRRTAPRRRARRRRKRVRYEPARRGAKSR